jgi:heterotetrameric sarcosine oxidase gamma subunit
MGQPELLLHSSSRLLLEDMDGCSCEGLAVRLIEPLHVLALRMLPGGERAALAVVAQAIGPGVPEPGTFVGTDPVLLWRSPSDWSFLTTRAGEAAALQRALPPVSGALCYVVDQSAGTVAFELEGPALDALLPRLMDASAIPRKPGAGTRARVADIAVLVLRRSASSAWLIADRANGHYLARWLAYACGGVAAAV